MAMLGAAVVEADVGEDCKAQARDYHVRLPRKGAHVLVYPPPSAQGFPDGNAEPRLWGRAEPSGSRQILQSDGGLAGDPAMPYIIYLAESSFLKDCEPFGQNNGQKLPR